MYVYVCMFVYVICGPCVSVCVCVCIFTCMCVLVVKRHLRRVHPALLEGAVAGVLRAHVAVFTPVTREVPVHTGQTPGGRGERGRESERWRKRERDREREGGIERGGGGEIILINLLYIESFGGLVIKQITC